MIAQLSAQDAQFLFIESGQNPSHVTLLSVYDPSTVPGRSTVRYRDIVWHIQSRLGDNPFMRRKLLLVPAGLDYPYWVDDGSFDIDNHMHHCRLPRPGDWRQLCIYLARFHSRPLDKSKPLWEMDVIEGLDKVRGMPEGCYAIATKIHHSALDGVALMRFFQTIADADNHGTPLLSGQGIEPEPCPEPPLSTIMRRTVLNNLRSPIRMIGTVLSAAPGLYDAAQALLDRGARDRQRVPRTRFDQSVSSRKVFDAAEFELADLQRIRMLAEGSTINDVVLAICSGALRRYLIHHDELPADPLVAWIPINARPSRSSEGSSGNDITATTVAIHTHVADAVERLRLIRKATRRAKNPGAGRSARLVTDVTKDLPAVPNLLASHVLIGSGLLSGACNLFVSNVSGPVETMYMNGARQVALFGLAPLGEGMGLFIGTPSYAGKIGFSVTSTREILPDIAFFITCLEESVSELKRRATGRARRGKKRSGRDGRD